MAQHPDLVRVYEEILISLGLASTDGLVSIVGTGKTPVPLTIGGKRMVLPTNDILRQSRWADWIAFHPLCEDAVAGESPIFKRLKLLIDFRLSGIIVLLMNELLGIAADSTKHDRLSPDALDLLKRLENINQNAKEAWVKISQTLTAEGDTKVIHLRVQRGGKVGNQGYRRAALITYPILVEFDKPELTVFGVKLSAKKTKKEIESMFKWLLDIDADPVLRHSAGSDAKQAPGFHAMMLAYASVMSRLADVADMFKAELVDIGVYDEVRPNLDWIAWIQDLSPYYHKIPVLAGNDRELPITGDVKEARPVEASEEVVPLSPRKGPGGIQVRAWSDRESQEREDSRRESVEREKYLTKDEEEREWQRAKQAYEDQNYSNRRYGYGYGGSGYRGDDRNYRDDNYRNDNRRDDRYDTRGRSRARL